MLNLSFGSGRRQKFWRVGRRPDPEKPNRIPRFLEAAASVLLYGSLASHTELQDTADKALSELQHRGFVVSGDPIRVYPAETEKASSFTSMHAAGWRPGIINLREKPELGLTSDVYLRHELFHEISHRSCKDKLPIWVEEAGAIAFSGEVQRAAIEIEPNLTQLKNLIRRDANLDAQAYQSLVALVSQTGWPEAPCQAEPALVERLGKPEEFGYLDYVLINIASGRVLEEHSANERAAPPGSLLKILFAAALRESDASLAVELARSDTKAILKRQANFDAERYAQLFPEALQLLKNKAAANSRIDATLLGERAANGTYPLELTVRQLAILLRTAVLIDSNRFVGIRANGVLPETTLAHADSAGLEVLANLKAWAKTGTASNTYGKPLVGHLLVVWPAQQPRYLAIFRAAGTRGAGVLARARETLKSWLINYGVERSVVRVSILSLLKRSEFSIHADCPQFSIGSSDDNLSFSSCGRFLIKTDAHGAKSIRSVSGLIEQRDDKLILTTDPESYADGVLESEAADLRGSARAALRAVIVWDGLHGSIRHADTASLCDTTHCMVFKGNTAKQEHTEPDLLALLDQIANQRAIKWFHFSRGGSEAWAKEFSAPQLAQMLNESLVLSVQRERSRSGAVEFHLLYSQGEETVGCEILRKALKLPSCPSAVVAQENSWVFSGQGKGHGLGLEVEAARAAARQGASARAILEQAFAFGE